MRLKLRKPSWPEAKKAGLILGFIALMGYVASYIPRRGAGKYRLTQSGELRLGGAFGLSDLEQWSPEACWWQPKFKAIHGDLATRGNEWGRFYSPLIQLDRKFYFPDRTVKFAEEFLKGMTEEAP